MNILILEDCPERTKKFKLALINHDVFYTDNTKICIDKLKSQKWDYLFLDHDLDGKVYVESGEGTGYEVAEWIAKNPEYLPKTIVIHSLNGIGSQKMYEILKFMKQKEQVVVYIPYFWELLSNSKFADDLLIEPIFLFHFDLEL